MCLRFKIRSRYRVSILHFLEKKIKINFSILYCTEAEFLDVIGIKSLKSLPPCYSQSPLLTLLNPPPPPPHPPSKSGLKLVYILNITYIRKRQVWELSRLCPENSTKLSVHEYRLQTSRLENGEIESRVKGNAQVMLNGRLIRIPHPPIRTVGLITTPGEEYNTNSRQ